MTLNNLALALEIAAVAGGAVYIAVYIAATRVRSRRRIARTHGPLLPASRRRGKPMPPGHPDRQPVMTIAEEQAFAALEAAAAGQEDT